MKGGGGRGVEAQNEGKVATGYPTPLRQSRVIFSRHLLATGPLPYNTPLFFGKFRRNEIP